jgi:glycosyltransferase involved in cell wall biosynthesis
MKAKKVLIITYFFPPSPEIGGLRAKGLAKYLPEFGWEPVILTASLPDIPDPQFNVVQTKDPGDIIKNLKQKLGLNREISIEEQIRTFRKLYYDKKNHFFAKILKLTKTLLAEIIAYPDGVKSWYSVALTEAKEVIRKEKFDAIISSSPPVTCHLIAKAINIKYKLPWVADLRDLWTQNHNYNYGPVRKLIERRLEINTLKLADALVTVSEPLAQKLRTLHKGKPIYSIPNGYDPDEVETRPLTREFTITYTGHIYKGKMNPYSLFKAISELISEGKIERHRIIIRFYGVTGNYWLQKKIEQFNLEDIVVLYPKIPRDAALNKQRESQILLLLNWEHPEETGVYTGKIFEYLAAKRPILAIGGPKGVVTELLEETGAGIHALNYEQLKQALLGFYNEYLTYGQVLYKGNWEKISRYSHREMAKKFAELLDRIIRR